MRTTGRRRLDIGLLGLGAVSTAAVAALGAAVGDMERVTQMWVGASLGAGDGGAVTEVIDYDFGPLGTKHGIFRTIPGLSTDDVVQVSSPDAPAGIADKSTALIEGEPGVELKIGDPATTVSGRHRYRLEYELPGLVSGARMSWDAVGWSWTVPVDRAEVHVVAGWRFADLTCAAGSVGTAAGGCTLTQPEPGHLVAVVEDLAKGEGITVTARLTQSLPAAPRLPAPPRHAPPDPGSGLALPAEVAGVAALLAAGVTSRLVRRAGRERVGAGGAATAAWTSSEPTSEVLLDHEALAEMATTEFAPPEGITAPMGGIILSESVRDEHKVAWLIEAAIAGAIDLDESDHTITLIRRQGGSPALGAPLDAMFAGRDRITLGRYDPTFAAGWGSVGTQLDTWHRGSGLWDATGDRRKLVARLLGGLALLLGEAATLGAAVLTARHGDGWLPAVAVAAAVAIGGWALVIRSWELRRRTPEGSALWLRVESFRRFLAHSEAHHAQEAAARGVLREYTAWAVALGEVDRWSRAVAASGTAIADQAGLAYVAMAPHLSSSTHSAATAPSSSGGGGGGSSVGGGGGGGGGGSW